jgi:hypothetical protein
MELDAFLPYILHKAKGCPAVLATINTRLAVIELCRKALIWREYQTSVTTVALQTAYAYSPAANQQVVKLLSMTLAGEDVPVLDPAMGKSLDTAGSVGPYAYGGMLGFELHPAQSAGLSVITYSVVAPSITATTIPDSMCRYVEEIANGALARILAQKDKEYSDPNGAALAMGLWMQAVDGAKTDAMEGFARVTTRTGKVWF